MTDQEKFIILASNEPLKKADTIILLEGDGFFRLNQAVKLYKDKWAPKIVFSGGIVKPEAGSFSAKAILPKLKKLGIPEKDIIIEDKSLNTYEQAVKVMALAKKNKWKKIILVASHYHQYRAFLTFLQAMREAKIKIQIINSPANDLPWFAENKWGKRINLLESEFKKIESYKTNGHIASFTEAIKYLEWKEGQK